MASIKVSKQIDIHGLIFHVEAVVSLVIRDGKNDLIEIVDMSAEDDHGNCPSHENFIIIEEEIIEAAYNKYSESGCDDCDVDEHRIAIITGKER